MSFVLTAIPESAEHPEMRVVLVTTDEDRDALYRLRRRIYVDEMGVLAPAHPFVDGEHLVDPYDAWSSNLLLRVGGVAAGSIRLTESAHGALEIDAYTDATASCPDPRRAAEVTRLMIRQDLRGGKASLLLLHGLWQTFLRSQSRYLLAAGKEGKLGRLYKNVCAAGLTVRPGTFEYGLTGCRYELLVADTGDARSVRRSLWRAHIRALALFAFSTPPLGQLVIRRGTTPRLQWS